MKNQDVHCILIVLTSLFKLFSPHIIFPVYYNFEWFHNLFMEFSLFYHCFHCYFHCFFIIFHFMFDSTFDLIFTDTPFFLFRSLSLPEVRDPLKRAHSSFWHGADGRRHQLEVRQPSTDGESPTSIRQRVSNCLVLVWSRSIFSRSEGLAHF